MSSLFYFSFYSRIYSHLQERVDQEHIAWHFYVPFYTFCSWAHTLVKIRNLCAHNEHLWNRSFTVTADELMYSNKLYWMSDSSTVERNKVYYILCILNFLLQTVNPQFGFSNRVFDLIQKYKSVLSLSEMGFPTDWAQEELWQMTLLDGKSYKS